MKTSKIISVLIAMTLGLTTVFGQVELSARQIQERSTGATRVQGTESLSRLTIINSKGKKRVRQMAVATKLYDEGRTEKKLIRFSAPADVEGIGFLTFDYNDRNDDKWIYMPALRKTRRIISSENAKSFMGSEFSYADMSLPNIDDFTYKLLGEETIDDTLCYKIEIVPIDDEMADSYGFSKKIAWIDKSIFVLRKAEYFNLFDEKEKVMEVESIIEVDPKNHKYRFGKITMTNILEDRKSISEILKIKFSPNLPDEYFTTRYIEK